MGNDLVKFTDPEKTPELEAHYQTLASYCSPEAEAFKIETQEQAQVAADLINDVKDRLNQLRAAEEYMTQDFVRGIDKIKALLRPAFEAATKAMTLWKRKLQDSERERREAASRAAREVQAAVERGDQAAAQAAVARVQPVERVQGISTRQVWKFVIRDVSALPLAYVKPDEARIREEMRAAVAAGKTPEIPGVHFYQEAVVAATG